MSRLETRVVRGARLRGARSKETRGLLKSRVWQAFLWLAWGTLEPLVERQLGRVLCRGPVINGCSESATFRL